MDAMSVTRPTPIAPMTPPTKLGGPTVPPATPAFGAPSPAAPTPLPIANPATTSQRPGGQWQAPTSAPADAKGGQVPLAMSPAAPSAAPVAPTPIPLAAGGATPYANATANTPGSNTDYTNKTITPGAGVDRLALAKSNFENFRTSTEPEYQATLRDASQQAAGNGQIGSGMARGRLGDIGLAHARDLQTAETGFMNDATNGSIADNYNNIGIAQQQQGFQNSQQNQAYQQQLLQQQLEEMLRNGQFGRSATALGLGGQGNPSDIALQLSGIYGNQAGNAGQAAGSLLGNSQIMNGLKIPPKAPTPYSPTPASAPWDPSGLGMLS